MLAVTSKRGIQLSPSKLKAAMDAAGASAADIARALDISEPTVSKWINGRIGKPDADNLLLLARLLSVSPDDLLEDSGSLPMSMPFQGGREGAARRNVKTSTQNDFARPGFVVMSLRAVLPGRASQLRSESGTGGMYRVDVSLLGSATNAYLVRVQHPIPELDIPANTNVTVNPDQEPVDGDMVLLELGNRLALARYSTEDVAHTYDGNGVTDCPWDIVKVIGVVLGGTTIWLGRP